METIQQFNSEHKEFVTDTAFDYYGKRMASCSVDGVIRIWEKDDHDEWKLQNEIQAHTSLITKIEWAHPMFGNIISACLYNSDVKLFKENVGNDGKTHWDNLYDFNTSSRSPCDIAFCPYNHGLKLAIASSDGKLVIVSPVDGALKNWNTDYTIKIEKYIHCVSWCKSIKNDELTLAIGTDNDAEIWSKDKTTNEWKLLFVLDDSKELIRTIDWANNIGHSYERLATGGSDGKVRIYEITDKPELKQTLEGHQQPIWKVEWNITGTLLASSGDNNTVRLWKQKYNQTWYCYSEILPKNNN